MPCYLDVSIGPVQPFIASARKTRDLWAGSFLLSYLCARAILGGQAVCSNLRRPAAKDDPLLQYLGAGSSNQAPKFGTVPNSFSFECADEERAQATATALHAAFDDAWKYVCDRVWDRYIPALGAPGYATREVWKRQTENFWRVYWAVDAEPHGYALAARKMWRSSTCPEEGGDKCTVMPSHQELSGCVRAHGASDRKHQDDFWKGVARATSPSDLRDGERLCAISLVKRLFTYVADDPEILGKPIDMQSWNSTVDVAATSWCDAAREKHGRDVLDAYKANVEKHLKRFDANFLHRSYLSRSPKNDGPEILDETARKELCDELKRLIKKIGSASPSYYAMLLVDGDKMGDAVGRLGVQKISTSLGAFMQKVPGIVSNHKGQLVYAGGDDVLALLPMDTALACAAELSKILGNAFKQSDAAPVTLSAGIVFAHIRAPLMGTLTEAHRLLADVAKKRNGRASMACSVFRNSGIGLEWSSTWIRPYAQPDQSGEHREPVDELVSRVVQYTSGPDARLSRSFLHRLYENTVALSGLGIPVVGAYYKLPAWMDLDALVRASFQHSQARSGKQMPTDDVKRLVGDVVELLRPARGDRSPDAHEVGLDGLLFAKFLADGGDEEGHVA